MPAGSRCDFLKNKSLALQSKKKIYRRPSEFFDRRATVVQIFRSIHIFYVNKINDDFSFEFKSSMKYYSAILSELPFLKL